MAQGMCQQQVISLSLTGSDTTPILFQFCTSNWHKEGNRKGVKENFHKLFLVQDVESPGLSFYENTRLIGLTTGLFLFS